MTNGVPVGVVNRAHIFGSSGRADIDWGLRKSSLITDDALRAGLAMRSSFSALTLVESTLWACSCLASTCFAVATSRAH
jgi:hypothetical protein